VKKIVSHPKYYAGGLHNDISLIFTDEPFILHDHVNTICLPEKNEVFTDKKCFSSGWGTKVYYNNYTIVKKTESGKLNSKSISHSRQILHYYHNKNVLILLLFVSILCINNQHIYFIFKKKLVNTKLIY
jgi:hypothetical protein